MDEDEHVAPRRIEVKRGPVAGQLMLLLHPVFAVPLPLVAAGVIEALGESDRVPWLPAMVARPLAVLVAVTAPLVAIAGFVLWRHLMASEGRAELGPERIVLTKRSVVSTIAWTELAGFRDASPAYVALVAREDGKGRWWWAHAVPTPTEADRTAVLDELGRRGIPRLEP